MPTYLTKDVPKYNHVCGRSDLKLKAVQYKQSITIKPRGFWYADGMDWLDYWYGVSEFEFNTGIRNTPVIFHIKGRYLYNVMIKCDKIAYSDEHQEQTNKIVILSSYEDVKNFTKRFGCNKMNIDWTEVAKIYVGFEMENYPKIKYTFNVEYDSKESDEESVNKLLWFTGVDINSGCIWNINHVRIKRVESHKIV